jgi:hypothetical protein
MLARYGDERAVMMPAILETVPPAAVHIKWFFEDRRAAADIAK